jgi:hypothetical protein
MPDELDSSNQAESVRHAKAPDMSENATDMTVAVFTATGPVRATSLLHLAKAGTVYGDQGSGVL